MKDRKLQRTLRGMSEDQLYEALYCDALTGLLNRRAFESITHPAVAILDLDSLKYVNDAAGHREGDALLCDLADRLKGFPARYGFKVYRLSGDEFVISGQNPGALGIALRVLQAAFPRFSYGVGRDLVVADGKLQRNKKDREAAGLRVGRGERPPWFNKGEVA